MLVATNPNVFTPLGHCGLFIQLSRDRVNLQKCHILLALMILSRIKEVTALLELAPYCDSSCISPSG